MSEVGRIVLAGTSPEKDENRRSQDASYGCSHRRRHQRNKEELIVIGSRGKNQIEDIYGQAELPVLAREHHLSRLYMQAAHEKDMRGQSRLCTDHAGRCG
jgi:hypothetical protein